MSLRLFLNEGYEEQNKLSKLNQSKQAFAWSTLSTTTHLSSVPPITFTNHCQKINFMMWSVVEVWFRHKNNLAEICCHSFLNSLESGFANGVKTKFKIHNVGPRVAPKITPTITWFNPQLWCFWVGQRLNQTSLTVDSNIILTCQSQMLLVKLIMVAFQSRLCHWALWLTGTSSWNTAINHLLYTSQLFLLQDMSKCDSGLLAVRSL